jgi:CubicO group peptidase (beta-lactamase class C family)
MKEKHFFQNEQSVVWTRMGRLALGIFVLGSLAVAGYLLKPSPVGRDVARYTLDTLREFPWLIDSYGFEDATAESQGLDSGAVKGLSESLARRGTKALLILRNGRIVHEWYGRFHGAGVGHYTAGLARALVGSMALLLATDDGWIRLDDRASRYIPGWRHDPLRSAITIRDLANNSSGIEHGRESSEPGAHAGSWREEYWRDHAKRFDIALRVAPVTFRPGAQTSYSGPGYAALSYALTASLQSAPVSDLEELLRVRIMRPLGVPDHHWTISYGSRFHQDGLTLYLFEGGGRYTARAAARVGQLIVERGTWKGQKILSSELIDALVRGALGTQALRPKGEPLSAIGWWNNAQRTWPYLPDDTLIGLGAGYQLVFVVPSRRLVVVRQGASLGGPECHKGDWQAVNECLLRPMSEIIDPPANRSL